MVEYQLLESSATFLKETYAVWPIGIAYIGWLWKALKLERNRRDGIPVQNLEIDHVVPRYKGGKDTKSNLSVVTRPEHAKKHYDAAMVAKKGDRGKEWGAVKLIVGRMSKAELKQFNESIKKKK